jgi:predicted DNA-binding transcriptional regulator AlpA
MQQNATPRTASLPSPGHPLGLVDLHGICQLLGVSRSSAERLIKNDPLFPKPFRIAGLRFVRFEDLQKWVSDKSRTAWRIRVRAGDGSFNVELTVAGVMQAGAIVELLGSPDMDALLCRWLSRACGQLL